MDIKKNRILVVDDEPDIVDTLKEFLSRKGYDVVGALDDSSSGRSGITGGISPDEGNIALLSYIKQNKFIYVFVAVIFGAMILVAIERNYKKRLN